MKAELEDEHTLTITPESTAEMLALKKLVGGKVTLKSPKPFTMNVEGLEIKAVEEIKP